MFITRSWSAPALLTLSVCALAPACGGLEAHDDVDGSAITATSGANPGSIADAANTVATLFDADPALEVRINDNGRALTDELLPLLSTTYGLDRVELSDQVVSSGTPPGAVALAMACHTKDARFELWVRDVVVRAPIHAGDVDLVFDPNKSVKANLDLSQFRADLVLEFVWPYDSTSWACTHGLGSDIVLRVNVNAVGVHGDLDLVMADASTGTLRVDRVEDLDLSLDSVSFDSTFLTTVTNLGLSVADVFGLDCGSLTACVNDAISTNLSGRSTLKTKLADAIEDAIAEVGTLDGAVNLGSGKLDYAVRLATLANNDRRDRMKLGWDVDVSTDQADAACAAGVTRSSFLAPGDQSTTNELELMVPYRKLTDVLYTVAKQGALCRPFTWSAPRASVINATVKPDGAFTIDSVSSNELSLSVGAKVEGSLSGTSGTITGRLRVTARLQPVCGGGFELKPTAVDLTDVAGSLSYQVPSGPRVTLSASTFLAAYVPDAEAALLDAIDEGLTVVPSSFGLSGLGKAVSLGQVLHDGSSLTVGLDVLDADPYCD